MTQRITRRSALAALAAAPAALAWGQSPPPSSAIRTFSGQVRLPDGRCLGYADVGELTGPLVLYFHGTPGSRIEVMLIAEEAAACGVRLVSIDRPGFGLSDDRPDRRVLDWPEDAQAVAAALGYGTGAFGVIGVSGGAPYALACVRCIPERLSHVAIVSGHTPMAEPGVPRGSQDNFIDFIVRRPRLARIAINVIIRRLHRQPSSVMQRIASQLATSDRQLLLGNAENRAGFLANLHAASRNGPGPILTAVNLLRGDWGFRLAELPPAPISIWQGGCDPIAPPAMGHYFHRQLAGSELLVDPKAGHVSMLKWHAREILSRFA